LAAGISASALVFLASDAPHFITGPTMAMDGGFMMLGVVAGFP
jgi:hypothetical protein